MSHLDVWFDVGSPHAWLASTEVEALAEEAGLVLRWRPISLAALRAALGRPSAALDALSPARRRVTLDDLADRARRSGLPWAGPAAPDTERAMAAVWATPDEQRPALVRRLFDAVWRDRLDVAEPEVLARVTGGPLPREGDVESLREATVSAAECGIFGVPTFVVGDHLEFGADRLERLRAHLGLPSRPRDPRPAPGRVEVFHDTASPYAYLGMIGVHALAERVGCEVVHRPILLGALFKQIGTPLVPIATLPPARQRWTGLDLERQAAALGVPFRFPAAFPLRTVAAQRILLTEPLAWRCLYETAWGRGLDLGDPGVLREALAAGGFDPELVDRSGQARDALIAATAEAVAAGVCGVPTFRVGGSMVWGQDRLDRVEDALRYGSP